MTLTLETFSPDNRTKHIGHSMYRIATDDYQEPPRQTVWYISETYNNLDSGEWSHGRNCFSTDLQKVIDVFNEITEEREIIRRKRVTVE